MLPVLFGSVPQQKKIIIMLILWVFVLRAKTSQCFLNCLLQYHKNCLCTRVKKSYFAEENVVR